MRWLLAILEALAALSAVRAEPPRYTVTNRTSAQPAFVVTNRIGTGKSSLPDPPDRNDPYGYKDYLKFREAVEQGHWLRGSAVLVVGIKDQWIGTYMIHCWVPSGFHGLTDGEWDCWYEDGRAVMLKREEVKPMARPFQPSHSTPTTPAPSVAVPSTSLVAPGPYRTVIPTPARRVILGGIRIGSDGCASPFG